MDLKKIDSPRKGRILRENSHESRPVVSKVGTVSRLVNPLLKENRMLKTRRLERGTERRRSGKFRVRGRNTARSNDKN